MKAKLRCFVLAMTAGCGLLISTVQPATAFEFFARLGGGAAQTCDACQKGASQKGACQKGACQKGVSQKGACQKGACQKGVSQKGVSQKGPRQKLFGAHQKGAVQKGGKGKGSVGSYAKDPYYGTVDPGAPLPPPIAAPPSA